MKNPILTDGDCVRVKKSRKSGNKLISYAPDGRAVIFRNENKLSTGYARISKILERNSCFIVTGENCSYDFFLDRYSDASQTKVSELSSILDQCGYNLEIYQGLEITSWSFQVWYNPGSKVVILVSINRGRCSSIKVLVPSHNLEVTSEVLRLGLEYTTDHFLTFDLTKSSHDFPVHYLNEISSRDINYNYQSLLQGLIEQVGYKVIEEGILDLRNLLETLDRYIQEN